jgi:hypothetical protein
MMISKSAVVFVNSVKGMINSSVEDTEQDQGQHVRLILGLSTQSVKAGAQA